MNVKESICYPAHGCQYKPFFLTPCSLCSVPVIPTEGSARKHCLCMPDCVAMTTWQRGCCPICHGVKKKSFIIDTDTSYIFLRRTRRERSVSEVKRAWAVICTLRFPAALPMNTPRSIRLLAHLHFAFAVRADTLCCILVTVWDLQATCCTNTACLLGFHKALGVQRQMETSVQAELRTWFCSQPVMTRRWIKIKIFGLKHDHTQDWNVERIKHTLYSI